MSKLLSQEHNLQFRTKPWCIVSFPSTVSLLAVFHAFCLEINMMTCTTQQPQSQHNALPLEDHRHRNRIVDARPWSYSVHSPSLSVSNYFFLLLSRSSSHLPPLTFQHALGMICSSLDWSH